MRFVRYNHINYLNKEEILIKYIFLFFLFTLTLFGGVIKKPIVSIDNEKNIATIEIGNIGIGISGFLVHKVSDDNSVILRNLEVVSFDKAAGIATLKMSNFTMLRQNSLPKGKWKPIVGDTAILAFGYTRALLIAPNEEIYYRITKATNQVQWIHPDIFATILSFNGHPTPLKEDFTKMGIATSVGLVFIYLNRNLFTVDIRSMKVINISDAPLLQDSLKLPFYSRVEEIEANWFGEGSDELEVYEPYYFELLIKYNPNNTLLKELYTKFKNKI
jgi:hypothetical protein